MSLSAEFIEAEDENKGLGQPLPIKLSRIMRFEEQPRVFFDENALVELADSIQTHGQKTPVRVCKHATDKGVFVLIGGERRWRAFHLIQKRTGTEPVVNAFVDAIKDHTEHFREALLDNLLREDLCAVDEAASYRKLEENGMSKADIARMVNKSMSHIDSYLKLHSLPDRVKSLMDASLPKRERLQTTIAIEIARSTTDPELRFELAEESLERQLGIMEARALITAKIPTHNLNRPGRKRRASDNYAILKNFIDRTESAARLHTGNYDIASLYDLRDNEENDRKRDAEKIDNIIEHLLEMKNQILESKEDMYKRLGV